MVLARNRDIHFGSGDRSLRDASPEKRRRPWMTRVVMIIIMLCCAPFAEKGQEGDITTAIYARELAEEESKQESFKEILRECHLNSKAPENGLCCFC